MENVEKDLKWKRLSQIHCGKMDIKLSGLEAVVLVRTWE